MEGGLDHSTEKKLLLLFYVLLYQKSGYQVTSTKPVIVHGPYT